MSVASAGTLPTGRGSCPPDVVRCMLDTLSPSARAELARALQLSLHRESPTVERRLRELGPLAAMLNAEAIARQIAPRPRQGTAWYDELTRAPGGGLRDAFPVVPANVYDQQRPAGALSSEQITAMFGGSWRFACRSVWGLQPDGRYAGPGQPWDNAVRGRPRHRYTDDECLDAIRACARRFRRAPTSNLYIAWSNAERRRARLSGAQPSRLPTYESFRQRWGGWPKALAAAALRPVDLYGNDQPPPPTDEVPNGPLYLDGESLRRIRGDRGIRDGDLRKAVGVATSAWRAYLDGRAPIGADALHTVAMMLTTAPRSLLDERRANTTEADDAPIT